MYSDCKRKVSKKIKLNTNKTNISFYEFQIDLYLDS